MFTNDWYKQFVYLFNNKYQGYDMFTAVTSHEFVIEDSTVQECLSTLPVYLPSK